MGEIVFARVDDRLIHGQIMARWSMGFNCNAIFVVDNSTANDPFMKDIYTMSTGNSGMTIKVLSIDEAIENWEKDNYGKYRVILLFKNIATVRELIVKGLPIKKLNVGGIAKTPDSKFVISSVALKTSDAELLKELNSDYGIEVFFQTLPDSKVVNLKNGLKSFG